MEFLRRFTKSSENTSCLPKFWKASWSLWYLILLSKLPITFTKFLKLNSIFKSISKLKIVSKTYFPNTFDKNLISKVKSNTFHLFTLKLPIKLTCLQFVFYFLFAERAMLFLRCKLNVVEPNTKIIFYTIRSMKLLLILIKLVVFNQLNSSVFFSFLFKGK